MAGRQHQRGRAQPIGRAAGTYRTGTGQQAGGTLCGQDDREKGRRAGQQTETGTEGETASGSGCRLGSTTQEGEAASITEAGLTAGQQRQRRRRQPVGRAGTCKIGSRQQASGTHCR